jgi:hypothetical protein
VGGGQHGEVAFKVVACDVELGQVGGGIPVCRGEGPGRGGAQERGRNSSVMRRVESFWALHWWW